MTKAIQALVPTTFDEVSAMSRILSKSVFVPAAYRGKEHDLMAVIVAGLEIGLPPMAATRAFDVIQGKPVMNANGMVAAAKSSPACKYFVRVESTHTKATYETQRHGAPAPERSSYTIEDAKTAGLLNKDNWRRHPAAMLRARCKAELARDVYPDVLSGLYTADEIEHVEIATVPISGTDTPTDTDALIETFEYRDAIDAEVLPANPAEPPSASGPESASASPPEGWEPNEFTVDLVTAMRDCDTLDELKRVAATAKGKIRTHNRVYALAALEECKEAIKNPPPPPVAERDIATVVFPMGSTPEQAELEAASEQDKGDADRLDF